MPESESPAPFAGINVVEFGQFIAVPFCAQLLAEGGANVIKVESLQGDPTRHIAQVAPMETRIFISRNQGKHSLPLNLRDPGARPVIDALLGWADVSLTNFRPGLAEQLGLDYPSLADRFPRLIVGSVTAFGDQGPDADLAGMDIVVQARSGLMAANGRMRDGRPASGDPLVADYMCAMSLAFGISSALLRRERTGRGGSIDTSLLQAAMTLANNQLIRVEDTDGPVHDKALQTLAQQREAHVSFAEQAEALPSARSSPMLKVYFRTFATTDLDIAVACGSHRLRQNFMQALELEDTALDSISSRGQAEFEQHYLALQEEVENKLRSQSSAFWVARLADYGVPVSQVKFPIELFDDEHVEQNGFLHTLDHPTVGGIRVVAPPVRIDGDGFAPVVPTAPFATETQALLLQLGFSEAEVESLLARGVTVSEPG